jgi:DnaJ like chaperone protein
MQWFGKGIGGLLGALVAGPFGSVVGVLLGHQWDETIAAQRRRGSAREISRLFFEVTFEVMGRIAKVDGRVSEDEIRGARRIMLGMRLTPDQVRTAIESFTYGKGSVYPLGERLAALATQLGDRSDLARAFVQIQLQAMVGAGAIGADKRQLLCRVASSLGVNRAELAQIEALVRGLEQGSVVEPSAAERLDDAYRVLGVTSQASDGEIKTAYRRLMNQHHPDKLVARGLPESMIGIAEQKTHEVRTAYERLKAKRGFK